MRIILALVLLVAPTAHAEITRGIPRGEEKPAVIESIFDSPFGEVQFTRVGRDGYSGFLRNSRGYLIGFQEVRGHSGCTPWLMSDKAQPLPGGCEFVFVDEHTGRATAVRSDEMTEATIFQLPRGKLRDAGRNL